MKVYNKFVESKNEPQNKNDIWFDGEYINLYKEGKWKAFTIPLDAAYEIKRIIEEDKSILQGELKKYLKIEDSPFKVKSNGDVCILGIGGYNGTNLNTAKSVQEVINELVNKLNEITTDG